MKKKRILWGIALASVVLMAACMIFVNCMFTRKVTVIPAGEALEFGGVACRVTGCRLLDQETFEREYPEIFQRDFSYLTAEMNLWAGPWCYLCADLEIRNLNVAESTEVSVGGYMVCTKYNNGGNYYDMSEKEPENDTSLLLEPSGTGHLLVISNQKAGLLEEYDADRAYLTILNAPDVWMMLEEQEGA